VNRIVSEINPELERYSAESDPDFEEWRQVPQAALLRQIVSDRSEITKMILEMRDDELARKGVHPVYGEMNIVEWTEFFLLHEAHHLFTIFQLKHEMNKV
jgi:hypothetical protein